MGRGYGCAGDDRRSDAHTKRLTKSVFCNVAAIGIIALTLSFARADHIDSPNYVAIPARSGTRSNTQQYCGRDVAQQRASFLSFVE